MSSLRKIKTRFYNSLHISFTLVRDINRSTNSGDIDLTIWSIYNIYEICFLKIFTAWERFLEEAFIAYLIGKSTRDCKPQRIVKRISENTAYELLTGTKPYPDWTNIGDIIKLANLFFKNGVPFSRPLESIRSQFSEIKKTRNAIVHISKTAHTDFLNLIRGNLAKFDPTITPGHFLSQINSKTRRPYIAHYTEYLKYAVEQIVC